MSNPHMKSAVDTHFLQFQAHLAKLVSINSENGPPENGKPLGEGPYAALCAFLEIAKELGFRTFLDDEGYYGYAEIGDGENLIGVLGHVDIVPAGDFTAWDTSPFTLCERDGALYARGVQDDKGPFLASLYGLYLLLKSGYVLKNRVRFIVCTDEELHWRCVHRYVQKEELPCFGFTPDSSFPLIYAEKGVLQYELRAQEAQDVSFSGGSAPNAVPDKAKTLYHTALAEKMRELGHPFTQEKDELFALGKAVHAKDAPLGENAVLHLCEALHALGHRGKALRFILEKACEPNGRLLFGEVEDAESGKLTLNLGKADFDEKTQVFSLDIRFPVHASYAEIDRILRAEAAHYGLEVQELTYLKPLYQEQNSPLVQNLLSAYRAVLPKDNTPPKSSGGATFARSMDNILAFGASLPGADSTEHQANEHLSLENLKLAIEIYAQAFFLLGGVDTT